jgi:5-methylcytosine-specific restriction enzyme B
VTARAVTGVFFWRYPKTAFRAAYGRLPGTLYTKDFFQCPAGQWSALDSVLGREGDTVVPVEFRWPGGSRQGEFRKSAADNRGQLAWVTADGAPVPWKIGDPAIQPAIAIPGNPGRTTEQSAEAELATLEGRNLDPWVVAVKLDGEERILHARAYLGNPPPGQERHTIQQLPAIVRDAMAQVPAGSGGAVVVNALRATDVVRRVLEALDRDPNVLLVGPPGTGKSVALEDLRLLFEGKGVALGFDPETLDDGWTEFAIPKAPHREVVSLAFHPSYGYEEFVAGLVPRTQGATFSLTARPGPLLSLAHWASDPDRLALLCLDEFNRGPTAAIFGDMLALLDKDKRSDPRIPNSGASIERPYPLENMEVAPKYANSSGRKVSLEVRIPESLWIVAAFNSSDRSVAPLDAALRRRFAILHIAPDYSALATRLGVALPDWSHPFQPGSADYQQWSPEDVKQLGLRLLRILNDRIGLVLGQDFTLGHAVLWGVEGSTTQELARALSKAFDERIASTLRLTFLDQDEALGAILNAGPYPNAPTAPDAARLTHWLVPPPDMSGVAVPRLQLREATEMSWQDALRALHSVL